MKKLYFLVLLSVSFGFAFNTQAQDFKAKQKSQEQTIKTVRKSGKITDKEYEKLMREQDIIKETIRKYEDDNYLTPHEKNVIYDKLVRAEKRLRRYKCNGEVY